MKEFISAQKEKYGSLNKAVEAYEKRSGKKGIFKYNIYYH